LLFAMCPSTAAREMAVIRVLTTFFFLSRAYVQALLPLFLRPVARFAACAATAGGPVAAAATILHRAGALPRNQGLEFLVRDYALRDGLAENCVASLVAGMVRCFC
jgi:hypothetical protein